MWGVCVCVNGTSKSRSYSTEVRCSKTVGREGRVIAFLLSVELNSRVNNESTFSSNVWLKIFTHRRSSMIV